MSLEARKIKFVQDFLNLQNEDVVSRLEKVLAYETSDKRVLTTMTQEEFHKRIDQSEKDFENGRFKTSAELLVKYE
ncbi:hypothetical protein [uncultured Kordia sp.]|uniref:hypothetical protein n=1 Tax=uncultured Kordia sp. TaxID=507699 RepID=UPI00260E853B|nr:hypothetical protein [uncultured Kordia sp.]